METGVLAEMVGRLTCEFIERHEAGYKFRVDEAYSPPTKWGEGQRTLTVTIICNTGEPRLETES